ncbi:MAG: DUF6547 family protein [Parvibaculaceae bacterium]
MAQHQAYKRFVDELVDISRVEVTAQNIREGGCPVRTSDVDSPLSAREINRKQFFSSLSGSQKEIVAEMLEEARTGGIHDVASFLEWALSCDELVMTWKGERIPESPYESMHFDFIARREGESWPDERATEMPS